MRIPRFSSAKQREETADKSEKDIREILEDSDERVRELFERHDPSYPSFLRGHQSQRAKENKQEK